MAGKQRAFTFNVSKNANITTNGGGTAINLLRSVNAGGREMKAFLAVPLIAGTNTTLDCAIQENTTSGASGWTDISGATFTQITTHASANSEAIHFKAVKQYVRGIFTVHANVTAASTVLVIMSESNVT